MTAPGLVALTLILGVSGGPVAALPGGAAVLVADDEQDAVWQVTPGAAARRLFDCAWPAQVLAGPDGSAFAACRQEGRVRGLGPSGGPRVAEVGAEPAALALDAATGELYVGLATGREVVVLDAATLAVLRRRALDFEPRALVITTGGLLVLPHHGCFHLLLAFGLQPELDERRSFNPGEGYGVGRSGDHCQTQQAIAWEGGALVAMAALETDFPATWALTSVFHLGAQGPRGRDAWFRWLDVSGLCARPEGWAKVLRTTESLAVGEGAALKTGPGLSAWAHPGALKADAARWTFTELLGTGVRGCAATATGWAVFEAHARTVAFLEPRGEGRRLRRVSLGASRLPRDLARGRALFFTSDRGVSSSGLSCQACHPDGREDAAVWETSGLPRQTPVLAGRLKGTAPFGWAGSGRTLEANIAGTVARLGGEGLGPADRRALAAFLERGLRPLAAPPPPDAAAVERGRALFVDDTVGCAGCHPLDDGTTTDRNTHDVGSVADAELARHRRLRHRWLGKDEAERLETPRLQFDTPSLRAVGLTPPYLHDGSAATLEELLEKNDDRMGSTRQLSAGQRADLAAFLRSL